MSRELRAWKKHRQHLADAQARLSFAEHRLRDFEVAYLKGHPLSAKTKAALVAALRAGRPLCCDAGRAVLAELVTDEIWQHVLNAWAYDHATCGTGRYHDENAAKLQLALEGGHFDPIVERAAGLY